MPKASELIAGQLRRQIILGQLSHGDLLPNETDLLGHFGVSRPTLREALRILESESLLHITRGSREGARVVAPAEATAARYLGRYLQYERVTVNDVQEAIMTIELQSVAQLVVGATVADLEVLDAAVKAEKLAVQDWRGWVAAGAAFHRSIVERAGNRTLAVMQGLLEGVVVASGLVVGESLDADAQDVAQRSDTVHRDLLTLIRAHKAEEAGDLWRRHLLARKRAFERVDGRNHALVDAFRTDESI